MEMSNFIIMKHELLLTLATLILLIAEITIDDKKKIISFSITLFARVLFGDMYIFPDIMGAKYLQTTLPCQVDVK